MTFVATRSGHYINLANFVWSVETKLKKERFAMYVNLKFAFNADLQTIRFFVNLRTWFITILLNIVMVVEKNKMEEKHVSIVAIGIANIAKMIVHFDSIIPLKNNVLNISMKYQQQFFSFTILPPLPSFFSSLDPLMALSLLSFKLTNGLGSDLPYFFIGLSFSPTIFFSTFFSFIWTA